MEIIYTSVVFLSGFAFFGLLWLAASLLKRYVKSEIARQFEAFQKGQENFFGDLKSNFTQNQSKILAKEIEIVQNENEAASEPEPPLWNNKEKLKWLHGQLEAGDFSDYRQESNLAELSPLEAWRKVDARLAEFEELES